MPLGLWLDALLEKPNADPAEDLLITTLDVIQQLAADDTTDRRAGIADAVLGELAAIGGHRVLHTALHLQPAALLCPLP